MVVSAKCTGEGADSEDDGADDDPVLPLCTPCIVCQALREREGEIERERER